MQVYNSDDKENNFWSEDGFLCKSYSGYEDWDEVLLWMGTYFIFLFPVFTFM